LLPLLDGESSFKDPGRIPPCLLTKIFGKTSIQKVFNESDSSFTAPRPVHSILWEMNKNARKIEH
jgi:hypothetical protein